MFRGKTKQQKKRNLGITGLRGRCTSIFFCPSLFLLNNVHVIILYYYLYLRSDDHQIIKKIIIISGGLFLRWTSLWLHIQHPPWSKLVLQDKPPAVLRPYVFIVAVILFVSSRNPRLLGKNVFQYFVWCHCTYGRVRACRARTAVWLLSAVLSAELLLGHR